MRFMQTKSVLQTKKSVWTGKKSVFCSPVIYIYPITFCFSLFFNRVTALDLCTKCVSPKYLPNKWLHFEKILLVLLSKFKMYTW